MARNYFKELQTSLDRALKVNPDRVDTYISPIADKIAWCWVWKKITDEEKDILCERLIEVLNLISATRVSKRRKKQK